MSRYDYLCMTCCYGLIGSLAWALVTANVWPLIAASAASGAVMLAGAVRGEP